MNKRRLKIKDMVWEWLIKKMGKNRLFVFIHVALNANEKGELSTSIRGLSTACGESVDTVRYFVEKPIYPLYTTQSTPQKNIVIRIDKYDQFVENLSTTPQSTPQIPHSSSKNGNAINNTSLGSSVVKKDIETNVSSNDETVAKPKPKMYDFRKQQKTKELPDVTKVVLAWKKVAGVDSNNPNWDKNMWPRHSRSAKQLIELMGNWKDAIRCMYWVWEWCEGKGLTCTIETVVKHTDTYQRETHKDMEAVI